MILVAGRGGGDVCWIYGTKKRWTMDYIALEDKRNYWTCDHYCESLIEQLAYRFKIITTRLLWKPFLTISACCDLPWEPIMLTDPIWPPRSTEAVSYPVLWLSSPGQCSGLSSVGWAGQTLRRMTGLGSFQGHILSKHSPAYSVPTHSVVLGVCWVSVLESKQIRVGKEPLGQHSPESQEVQKTSLRNEQQES